MTTRQASATSGTKSGQQTTSVVLPTVANGELCTLLVTALTGLVPTTAPSAPSGAFSVFSGPTAIGSGNLSQVVYVKALSASDSAAQVDVTFASGVRTAVVAMLDTGMDATPILGTPVTVTTAGQSATSGVLASAVSGSKARVLVSARPSGSPFTATIAPGSSTWTEVAEVASASTTLVNAIAQVSDTQLSGSAGAPSQTLTSTQPVTWIVTTMLLEPVAAPPPPPPPSSNTRIPGIPRVTLFCGAGQPGIKLRFKGLWNGRAVMPATVTTYRGSSTPSPTPNPTPNPTPTPTGTGTFAASGLAGGGFQNVISQSPFVQTTGPEAGTRPVVLGADVAGTHRSIDGGVTWKPCLSGIFTKVAALSWSKTTPGKVYALCDPGLYLSTDWGRSWTKKSAAGAIDAQGNGNAAREQPRQTGRLIATDNDDSHLWVATLSSGVQMSTDNGKSWTASSPFTGKRIRGIFSDPNDPDTLYVALRSAGDSDSADGVWKVANATTTMSPATKLGTWPAARGAEELFCDDNAGTTTLYAVANRAGCFSWNGSAWSDRSAGLDAGGNLAFQSITGDRASGSLVLYVGGAALGAVGQKVMYRGSVAANGTVSWSNITAYSQSSGNTATVVNQDFGGTHKSFISTIGFQDFANNTWVASQIIVDKDDPTKVWVAGRGGVWIGIRQAPGSWKWQPSTTGLMVTVNMWVGCDPKNASRVAIGSMDYTVNATKNNGVDFAPFGLQAQAGAPSTGDAGAFDALPTAASPAALVVGASARGKATTDPSNGVYLNLDPWGSGTWAQLPFPATAPGYRKDVPAVSLGRTGAGGTQVILAAATGGGFYRKQGTADWTSLPDLPGMTGTLPIAYFQWKPASATVFVHAPGGIWRSTDSGQNWTKIWDGAGTSYARYDSIQLDKTNSEYLYVSAGSGGLVRIKNALSTTAVGTTVSDRLTATPVGPIALDPGTGALYAAATSGALLEYLTPRGAGTPSSTDRADQFWRDNGKSLRSIGITPDGYLFSADNGQGCMVGSVRAVATPYTGAGYGAVGTYKPGPTTTGVPAGTTLTQQTGDVTVTVAGTVLDKLDIHGRVLVRAANVTIKRCIVRGRSSSANESCIDATNAACTGLVVQDCELVPEYPSIWVNGINGHDFTAQRLNIHNVVDGFGVYNTSAPGTALNVVIEQCWVHDFAYFTPDVNHSSDNQTHNDGVQVQGGTGAVIRGNFIDSHYGTAGSGSPTPTANPTPSGATSPALSCVLFNTNVGTTGGHTITDNWFSGGYIPINCGGGGAVNLGTMWRNRFGRDSLSTSGTPQTILLRADQTCDTGDGTSNQNTFSDNGAAVLVRHNGGGTAPAAPIWAEEFTGTDLSYATDTGGGTWRTKGYEFGGTLATGFKDAAGSNWNLSPTQHPTHNPFSVANSILTITAKRVTSDVKTVSQQVDPNVEWMSGYLVSNHLTGLTWRYGYFEWRARFPNPARGMFPALWLFNNDATRSDGYEGAEIDVLEIFGNSNGQPWASGWHARPSGTASLPGGGTLEGNVGYWGGDDTTGWHRYGVNWTADAIEYYYDGVLKGTLTYSPAVQWMRNARMGVRINLAIDPSYEPPQTSPYRTTTSDPALGYEFRMDVDYVRVYATKPTSLATGSADPLNGGVSSGGGGGVVVPPSTVPATALLDETGDALLDETGDYLLDQT